MQHIERLRRGAPRLQDDRILLSRVVRQEACHVENLAEDDGLSVVLDAVFGNFFRRVRFLV